MKIVNHIIDFLLSLRPVKMVYVKLKTPDETEQRVIDELKRYFSQPHHGNTVTQHSRCIPLQNWDCPIYGDLYLITKAGRLESFSQLLKENGFTMLYQECDMLGGKQWDIWETETHDKKEVKHEHP